MLFPWCLTKEEKNDEFIAIESKTFFQSVKAEFKKNKTIYMDHMLPYEIERWQNYEIDDIYDFICIETIMKRKGLNDE